MREEATRRAQLSMFPLQVQSVRGVETAREVRTSCGLFRRSTHILRKSGPSPDVLQAGGDASTWIGLLSGIQQVRLKPCGLLDSCNTACHGSPIRRARTQGT
jgi:hypothetical protein